MLKEILCKKKGKNTLKVTFMARKEKQWYFIYLKIGNIFNENLLYYQRKKLRQKNDLYMTFQGLHVNNMISG